MYACCAWMSSSYRIFHADVSEAAQVQAVANACEKTLAKVDILFNVAGRDPIRQTSWQSIDRSLF
jgi:NAD(P)-dependent dehydrogenase (short-subunit alcohol dehydrogenase family)